MSSNEDVAAAVGQEGSGSGSHGSVVYAASKLGERLAAETGVVTADPKDRKRVVAERHVIDAARMATKSGDSHGAGH